MKHFHPDPLAIHPADCTCCSADPKSEYPSAVIAVASGILWGLVAVAGMAIVKFWPAIVAAFS